MQRVTVSMDERLAEKLDLYVEEKSYTSRSEAVRDILRSQIADWDADRREGGYCAAVLSFVCDSFVRDMPLRLERLMHEHHDLVVSKQSAPLGHSHSLQTVILRGETSRIRHLAAGLAAERGVIFDALNLIGVEPNDLHSHDSAHSHDGLLHLDPVVK
ncbi:MAG: nickel-responsive transcriptional regulator NikR [Pseudomonadota bacterium]